MNLATILEPEAVFPSLDVTCDKQALLKVADFAAGKTHRPAKEIFESLMEREKLGSTACGAGVAIPHARLVGLKEVVCEFVKLKKPIPFNAPDGKPVDLFFVIFAPSEGGAEHLRALSRIARMLRDPELCEALRQATSREVMYRLLIEHAA